MMFVGFGFLMTFLKRYGYSAVALNFMIAAIVLQWATLCQGFYHTFDGKTLRITIERSLFVLCFKSHFLIVYPLNSMLNADFASASVLISFGAVLGVTTPLQLIIMAICEIAVFASNEHLGLHVMEVGFKFKKLPLLINNSKQSITAGL